MMDSILWSVNGASCTTTLVSITATLCGESFLKVNFYPGFFYLIDSDQYYNCYYLQNTEYTEMLFNFT